MTMNTLDTDHSGQVRLAAGHAPSHPAALQYGYAGKRSFDIAVSLLFITLLLPVMAGIALAMVAKGHRPILYISERMSSRWHGFQLIKFRTMRALKPGESDVGVSCGATKRLRVTAMGRFLRDKRLDELPQLFNVLRGDISLVGPRPPLRRHTDMFPRIYDRILMDLPGLTGLASVIYHRHEETILGALPGGKQSEAVYIRRCLPRKARIDLIYQRNASLALDCYVLYLTAAKFVRLPGRRARRMRLR